MPAPQHHLSRLNQVAHSAPWLGVVLAALSGLVPESVATGESSPAEWIPASAVAFVATGDVRSVNERWQSTQLSKAWQHEAMRPFRDNWRTAREGTGGESVVWYGLTWDDLTKVADGAAALAIAPAANDAVGSILLVHVGGNRDAARSALNNLFTRMEKAGADRRDDQLQGGSLTSLTLPGDDDKSPAIERYCFLDDRILIIADQRSLLEGALSLRGGSSQNSLAKHPGYQAVRKRVREAMNDRTEDLTWYVTPIQYSDLLVKAGITQANEDWQMLRPLGYEVFQAIGGGVCLTGDGRELESVTAVYAPGKLQKAAQWFSLKPLADIALPDWIPDNVATATQWSWDYPAAFSAYGYWFDHKYAEGEEGVFDDVLLDILEEPDGPQIDVRKELIQQLSTPTTMATFSPETDLSAGSQVVAMPVADSATVERAVRRMLEGDPDVQPQSLGERTAWVFRNLADEQRATDAEPASMLGPDLSGVAIVVAQDSLFSASDAEVLRQVVENKSPPANEVQELVRIRNEIQQRAAGPIVGWRVSQPRRGWRGWYESLRGGTLPTSDSIPGALLDLILPAAPDSGEETARAPRVDFTLLPEVSALEPYLLPMGFWAEATEDGWLIVGFAPKPSASSNE